MDIVLTGQLGWQQEALSCRQVNSSRGKQGNVFNFQACEDYENVHSIEYFNFFAQPHTL